jgi:hypothetical protein
VVGSGGADIQKNDIHPFSRRKGENAKRQDRVEKQKNISCDFPPHIANPRPQY